ncbi:MAG: porin [Alphaproteobacteria bacterium]
MTGGNKMKKLLLASVAISGLALAAPAHADIDLEVGGYFKGYGAFVNQDETSVTDVNAFDMLRETELHFGGETTLDNGLTVGAHIEYTADGADTNAGISESYVYFSGNWGRVNVGNEDGAGYLLQVAAPSADSNVDGISQYVSGFVTTGGLTQMVLDYGMDPSDTADKVTYLSPILSGFQVGASMSPDTDDADQLSVGTDTNAAGSIGETYEIALRYEGEFENVGVTAGAGYSLGKEEGSSATTDDREVWNVGLDLDVAAFGLGVVYVEDNQGFAGTASNDREKMVVGADYTTGPFKLGVSYFNQEDKATNGVEYDRYTGGVVYEYGPGMSFRGSVQFLEQENPGAADADGTAVLLGTQINF